jgi:hypothetical protein
VLVDAIPRTLRSGANFDVADDVGEDVDEIDVNSHLKRQRPPAGAEKQANAILKGHKTQIGSDDPFTPEEIGEHNSRVLAERQLNRTNQTTALADPESDERLDYELDGSDPDCVPLTGEFLAPEPGEYDPAPKAVTNFAVASKAGRMSKAEMAKRKILLDYRTELRATLANNPRDPIKIGRFVDSAKKLVGHGGFEKWVTDELQLPARTAQSYIKAAKNAQS